MKIIEVTDSNVSHFNRLMENPAQKAVIKFYADWCGHCKELNKKWPELEQQVKKIPSDGILASVPEPMMSKVHCDNKIRGFPEIQFMVGGKKKKDYNGKREVKDLAKFIKKKLGKCKKTNKKKTRPRKRKKKRKRKKTQKRRRKGKSAKRERFFKMISLK
jgi:protein disulfide-isomerase A6